MERDGELLFVYGTLKRGLLNHHHLSDAPFLGEAEMPGVRLHDLGPFPMAIAADGLARGELYVVDGDRLAHLDRFEGVPRLYRREYRRLSDGRQAWIYLGQPRQVRHSPRLEGGLWPPVFAPAAKARSGADRAPFAPGLRRCGGRLRGRCQLRLLNPAESRWREAFRRRIPTGRRPHRRLALLLALLTPLPPVAFQAARAEASLSQCQRWQRSGGQERILLGNAIGAAAYLTKVQRFAESDPDHPQLLYTPADLQRACDGWR